MNVIKVKNLNAPEPSEKEMRELRASLAALAGPDDPLTLSVSVKNWPGRQAVHLVYFVGLRTVAELTKLDESKLGPMSWRLFAGGHKNMTTANGCMATHGGPGLPPVKVLAVTRGPAPAAILTSSEMLNDLSELSADPNNQYDLRVLRMPALGVEAFWLKSHSAELGDLVVPYTLIPTAWDLIKPETPATAGGSQVYSATDFLTAAAGAAQQRLAKPDIAPGTQQPAARKPPAKQATPPPAQLPKPGSTMPAKGVGGAGKTVEGVPAKPVAPPSEPVRETKPARKKDS